MRRLRLPTLALLILCFFYGLSLYFFYIRYVPLVKSFQAAFLPILSATFLLTVFKPVWGTLFFIFLFPLINNLPYFFGIYEPLPHAPAALTLFLYFFYGWLVNKSFSKPKLNFNHSIFRSLTIFALILFISALITIWRYANFFPILSDYIYELKVNAIGVSAGGAIMSTVFFSLNYLTGIAFFVILFNEIKSWQVIQKIVLGLAISTLFALLFGLYQHLGHPRFGNNPISISGGLINATFKDALSFGVYIAMISPLLLALVFYLPKKYSLFPIILLLLASYLIFFTGSKSGLICLCFSLITFLFLMLFREINLIKTYSWRKKRVSNVLLSCFIALSIFLFISFILKENIYKSITISRLASTLKQESINQMLSGRINLLWKLAIEMMKDYPFTGVGLGGYIIEAANYAKNMGLYLPEPESAENYLLQVGAEMGAVGLFLILWIFWEIVKQTVRTYKFLPNSDRRKPILMASMAGIIAFFLNVQTHTYIGSYEIKYTLWLLVSLIFAIWRVFCSEDDGAKGKLSENKIGWPKLLKAICLLMIAVFGFIHLWNSTHSLSLKSKTEQLNIKQEFGLYPPEKTNDGRDFRWTGKYGALTLKIEKPVISIPLLVSHPDIYGNPVKVSVYMIKELFHQKHLLKELTIDKGIWQSYKFYIPEELGQELIFLFKVNRTWNPLKWKGTPDPRNLGVAIGRIEFYEK